MSEFTDSKQSADLESRKRCPLPDQDEECSVPSKFSKVEDPSTKAQDQSESCKNGDSDSTEAAGREPPSKHEEEADAVQRASGSESTHNTASTTANNSNSGDHESDKPQSSKAQTSADSKEDDARETTVPDPCTLLDQSDSAAIAAAEALASLTGGDGEDSRETPCSSERAKQVKQSNKMKNRGDHQAPTAHSKTQAAAADSSTSMHSTDRDDAAGEGDESMSGSSSTPSSSFPSENEDNEDGECAIVSVKMAPEMRQSVALLAQVQMRLEALEKKSAWLHQRLEQKISRMRRPHLDQRSSITKTIPGFWVTALLNHPHLSAHIDETDEDALSYMVDLEIETFKNHKVGFRIRFHFRRNPYFQNNIIMKELHLGLGESPMSISNPILWNRGHNLTANSEPRKMSRGVYQTFFSWFSDHSNPSQDDVAQILKDDLYRDPLRYYLTPLWQPRENGSDAGGDARAADGSNGDDCVVISDSDDDPGEEASEMDQGHNDGEEEEEKEEEAPSAEGSQEEDEEEEEEGGEIVIDGSDDSDHEDEEA
uniref:testis specific protein Y-linked n=1 Tax=Doryrhamphus excisus TaxID=161450 RepID=UPI0025AE301B|nr:testis specific protein Y-linked [Doryrhamphus excisus]XP_057907044.1 testis specific protein Y-linked [Doryrhamphus excisus]